MRDLRNLAVALSALVAFALALPAATLAGHYRILSCGALANSKNNAWSLVNNDPAPPSTGTMESGSACGSGGTDGGLFVRERMGAGARPWAASFAYWQFDAPPGTTITRITYDRYLEKNLDDGSWQVGLRDETGDWIELCGISNCFRGAAADGPGANVTYPVSSKRLQVGAWCVPWGGVSGCVNGAGMQAAHAVIYDSWIAIDDPIAPSNVRLTGVPEGWTNKAVDLDVSAADATGGIASRAVAVNGDASKTVVSATCDETYVNPCPTTSSGTITVAPQTSGVYRVAPVATDAGGNQTTGQEQLLRFDRDPPPAPGVDYYGSSRTWERQNSGFATFDVPVQANAPITTIITQICPPQGLCETPREDEVTGPGQVVLNFPLAADGLHTLHAWMRDAAGNEDPRAESRLQFGLDRRAPELRITSPASGYLPAGDWVGLTYDYADAEPASPRGETYLEMSVDNGPWERMASEAFFPKARVSYSARAIGRDAAGNIGTSPIVTWYGVAPTPNRPTQTNGDPSTTGPATTPVETPPGPTTPVLQPPIDRLTAAPILQRRPSGLRLTSVRSASTRTLTVRGTASRRLDAQRVTLRVSIRNPRTGRTETLRASVPVRAGRFAARVTLPKRLRSARAVRTVRVVATTRQTSTTLAGTAKRRIAHTQT